MEILLLLLSCIVLIYVCKSGYMDGCDPPLPPSDSCMRVATDDCAPCPPAGPPGDEDDPSKGQTAPDIQSHEMPMIILLSVGIGIVLIMLTYLVYRLTRTSHLHSTSSPRATL